MKILMKRSLLAITLATLTTTSAFAAQVGSGQFGLQNGGIQGWRPYMASIGSKIVVGGQDNGNGGLIPTVGTVIEIPTYTTGDVLFKFIDKDGDIPAGLGYGTLPNGSDASKEFRVEWYIIEADDWNAVTSWDDLTNATKIETAIADGGNVKNANSHTLVVPEGAAGKRLGFIAYPESEYGVPANGNPVKAWDLSKIWTQTEPTEPGECVVGDKDCEDNGNGNGGDNNNGGGGEVVASEYAITLYDAKTNLPLKPDSKLTINQEFFATIRIKDGETYRDPSSAELATLTWNMLDSQGNVKFAYAETSGRLGQAPEGETFGPDKLVKYTFTTQSKNTDAAVDLQTMEPNFSEQGFGLSVTLTTE